MAEVHLDPECPVLERQRRAPDANERGSYRLGFFETIGRTLISALVESRCSYAGAIVSAVAFKRLRARARLHAGRNRDGHSILAPNPRRAGAVPHRVFAQQRRCGMRWQLRGTSGRLILAS